MRSPAAIPKVPFTDLNRSKAILNTVKRAVVVSASSILSRNRTRFGRSVSRSKVCEITHALLRAVPFGHVTDDRAELHAVAIAPSCKGPLDRNMRAVASLTFDLDAFPSEMTLTASDHPGPSQPDGLRDVQEGR